MAPMFMALSVLIWFHVSIVNAAVLKHQSEVLGTDYDYIIVGGEENLDFDLSILMYSFSWNSWFRHRQSSQ